MWLNKRAEAICPFGSVKQGLIMGEIAEGFAVEYLDTVDNNLWLLWMGTGRVNLDAE